MMRVITVMLAIVAAGVRADVASPNTNLTGRAAQILAAASTVEKAPHFNGPAVFGVRPGTPFLEALTVTGERPITFAVENLPDGLSFDAGTGIVSGALARASNYVITAYARNANGAASQTLNIRCGDRIALLPPLGWNSYDAYGDSVREDEVLTNAVWMREHLQPYGWDTVVVDFRWYDRLADGVRVQEPEGVTIDVNGRRVPPTNRFPSAANDAGFKPLADKLHAMGLKFGIHIMRGIPRKAVERNLPIADSEFTATQAARPEGDPNRTCVWNRDMYGVEGDSPAGRACYKSIARQYADWGVDYIKCDDIANLQRGIFYDASEIEALSTALGDSGRSIILSLSPGPSPVNCSPHLKQFANMWRISGDFWDRWESLDHNFDLFAAWLPDAAPGHWPDGDMIPLGHIGERNCDVHPDRWTHFTPDEQVTLMSLWALEPSPMMLGMNLPDNDAWTTALLTNPEVLAVNQDSLAAAARRMTGPPVAAETWTKELSDGSYAVGLFNRTDKTIQVRFPWRNLGFASAPEVRDLWLHQTLPPDEFYTTDLAPHACVLLKVDTAHEINRRR